MRYLLLILLLVGCTPKYYDYDSSIVLVKEYVGSQEKAKDFIQELGREYLCSVCTDVDCSVYGVEGITSKYKEE